MNKRILFSDFDGTLYVNSAVSTANREAIRRWRAAGNLFAMASGRYVGALREHLNKEEVDYDFLVCLNGAEAYDRKGNLLFEQPIRIEILNGLFDALVQNDGWANVCYGDRADRIRTEICSHYNPDHPHYPRERLSSFCRFTQICTGYEDMDTAFAARDRVLARYGEYVSAQINGRNLDVNAASVRKSGGIQRLIDQIGIPPKQVVTVGDNFNDLCMLTAYRGYAVAHAPGDVRRKAYGVVTDVAQLVELLMRED